jgi:hypothetical protein
VGERLSRVREPDAGNPYEKLGGVFGGFQRDSWSGRRFEPGKQGAEIEFPSFSFKKDLSSKLPNPGVPFGLAFTFGEITDDGLGHLAGLKDHLRILKIAGTKVTGKCLRHLAGLTDLKELDLAFAEEIGDRDLKEVAAIKNLDVRPSGSIDYRLRAPLPDRIFFVRKRGRGAREVPHGFGCATPGELPQGLSQWVLSVMALRNHVVFLRGAPRL